MERGMGGSAGTSNIARIGGNLRIYQNNVRHGRNKNLFAVKNCLCQSIIGIINLLNPNLKPWGLLWLDGSYFTWRSLYWGNSLRSVSGVLAALGIGLKPDTSYKIGDWMEALGKEYKESGRSRPG